MNHYQEYIDINKRKGLPRSYWFNPVIRWFTLLFSIFAIVYSLFLIFTRLNADSSTLTKAVPFLILFFALNSLLRNIFSLNQLHFTESHLEMKYLALKKVIIPWESFVSLKLGNARQKRLVIKYRKADGSVVSQDLTFAFPKMLEILNSILELTPEIELDEFMQSVMITKEEKNRAEELNQDNDA